MFQFAIGMFLLLTAAAGVAVKQVVPEGPAADGGLRVGDSIRAIDGRPVEDFAAIQEILGSLSPGDRIDIAILRENDEHRIAVELGDLGPVLGEAHAGEAYLGAGFDPGARYPEGEFRPVSFDISRSIDLDAPPEAVLPLLDPLLSVPLTEGRSIDVVFQPDGGRKQGSVYRIPRPGGRGGTLVHVDTWDVVDRIVRYSIYYPDLELEKLEFRCEANGHGGTTVHVREIIMGLNNHGIRAVTSYVERGGVEEAIEAMRTAIDRHLKSEARSG